MKINLKEIDLTKVNWKKIATYGAVIGMAAVSAISDQKKEDEFQAMKETLAKLSEKES